MWYDIPQSIAKRNQLDYFIVLLKKQNVNYTVTYLIDKNHSPYQIGHDKYAMFIKWREGDNIAVVIGQNPSVCKTIGGCRFHPDETNWNIIKILKKMGYDGYIMVNTFSGIDPNGKQIKNIPKQNRNIAVVKKILNNKQISKAPIILACTHSNCIALDFIQFLKKYQKRLHLIQGKFNKPSNTHPLYHFASQALNSESYDYGIPAKLIPLSCIQLKDENKLNNSCLWNIK